MKNTAKREMTDLEERDQSNDSEVKPVAVGVRGGGEGWRVRPG